MKALVRTARGLALLYLYYPHVALLRAVGPRLAVMAARAAARIHSAGGLSGTQRKVRTRMQRVLGGRRPDLDARAEAARWLQLQHQYFVEWRVYPTARGRAFVRDHYRIEGREHLEAARADGKGVLGLVFHFGMGATVWAALREDGHHFHRHVFRGAHYATTTPAPIARVLLERSVSLEQQSGVPTIYHRPFFAFTTIMKLLAKGGLVGVNGDGMMGTDFVEVPFLDGAIQLPTGPANLSARSGAPLLPMYSLPVGPTEHVLRIHPPVRATGTSPEELAACVRSYVAPFEQWVQDHPWAWWTWDRLDISERDQGGPLVRAKALPVAPGSYHDGRAPAAAVTER